MPRTAFCCERCDEHVVWVEGVNNAEVKRFVAEHEKHAGWVMVGEETSEAGVFEFTHAVGLPS